MALLNSLIKSFSGSTPLHTCRQCGNPELPASWPDDAEYGNWIRSHRCRGLHSYCMIFTGLAITIGLPYLAYCDAEATALQIDWFNRAFGFMFAGLIVGPTMIVAGMRNSSSKLDLFENGIVFSTGSHSWKCSFGEIKRILTLDANGANGLRFLLKDNSQLDAMLIADQDRAANFVISQLYFKRMSAQNSLQPLPST